MAFAYGGWSLPRCLGKLAAMSTKGAEHLARHVLARRVRLDFNQLDVHAEGGPSNTLLTTIENGRLETLTRSTARKLDRGLRWEPGSARAVWEGGEPTPLQSTRVAANPEAEVRALGLPPDQEQAVLEIVRDLLPARPDIKQLASERFAERGLAEHFEPEASDDTSASGSA